MATYDVSLYYNDELYNVEGFFNIAIDIPEKFEKIYDLKITAVDSDGNTILLNTIRKDGKLIVSTSGEYSQFAIVAKSNLWKIITASVLGGLSLLICVYLIVLIVKKKKHIART